MTDENANTADLTIDEKLDRILSSLDTLEAEAKGEYEAARLRLIQMQMDPNLTDEQREAISAALREHSI